MPHKHSANGRTYYYDGRKMWPVVIVMDSGEMYPGWDYSAEDLERPEIARIIGQADKRAYVGRA